MKTVLCLILLLLAGCGYGTSIDDSQKALSDRIRKIRSDAENLKSEYESAVAANKRKYEELKGKDEAIQAKIKQLEKMLASLGAPLPAPDPVTPPDPVKPDNPKPSPDVKPVVPNPPDPPGPQFPDGQFSISADIYKWANELVDPEKRSADALLFYDAAIDMAEQIKPGDPARKPAVSGLTRYDLAMKIQDLIGKRNKSIPLDVIARWKTLESRLNDRINTLFDAGKLTRNEDWATLFREIALGLKEIKGR